MRNTSLMLTLLAAANPPIPVMGEPIDWPAEMDGRVAAPQHAPPHLARVLRGTYGRSPGTRAKRRWKLSVRAGGRRNRPRR